MIKKNLLYNSLLSLSQVLFPLIIFPYTLKVLEPDGIGLISFTENLTQYILALAAVGIPIYGVIEVAKHRSDESKLQNLFTELICIQTIITTIILIIYLTSIFYLQKLTIHKEFYFLSAGIILSNIFTVEWYFQGTEQFKYITTRTIIVRFLYVFLVFFLVKSKSDLLLFYTLTFFTNLLNAIINFTFAQNSVKLSFKNLNLTRHVKPLFYIFFSNVAISIYIILDNVILGFIKDNVAVGYYSTAIRVCKIPLVLLTALSTVLVPKISASYAQGKNDYVLSLLQKSFTYIIALTVPISMGLYLLAPEIILLIANEKYLPSVNALRIMIPIIIFIGLNNFFGIQILTSQGKQKYTLIGVATGMIFSIIFNLLLVPHLSYIGSAITTALTEAIVTIITGWFAIKTFKLYLPYSIIWQSILTSLLFIPIYYWCIDFTRDNLGKIILMIGSCSIIYFIIHYFLFKNILLKNFILQIVNKINSKH